jgi:hypothetical protein
MSVERLSILSMNQSTVRELHALFRLFQPFWTPTSPVGITKNARGVGLSGFKSE